MAYAQTLARPYALASRASFWSVLTKTIALAHQRAALARLDDHLLEDIGVTRDEARAEADRAPWDAPAHWQG